MNKNLIKAAWLLPIGVGLYLIYKQYKKKSPTAMVDIPQPKSASKSNTSSSVYPLKKGSNNDTVKTLQSILNSAGQSLVVDGIFGSKTQAALQSVYGKTQIDNAADLDVLRNQIKSSSQGASNLDWGFTLVDDYNKGRDGTIDIYNQYSTPTFTSLIVKEPVTLLGVSKDSSGSWDYTNGNVNLAAGTYSLDDYAIRAVLNGGALRIEILNGSTGMYCTPNNIDLSSTISVL